MRKQRYIQRSEGVTRIWHVPRIWQLAESLPVEEVLITDIRGPDEVTWFSPTELPTCRAIIDHCRRINQADLSYPVILTQNMCVFDGMHRIAKCIMEGRETILVKRFTTNPEPDETFVE